MSVTATSALLVLVFVAQDKPVTKLPVGKDTTYVTGPLDKDGYIDFEAALNERLGKGITPDKNANVLLWKAFGPRPERTDVPPEFFTWLGIPAPPAEGEYFIGLPTYVKDHVMLAPAEREAVLDQEDRARRRLWAAKDYPYIAGWLKVNDKPLALAVEATKRPDYFNPLVSRKTEKGPGGLIGALLPSVQKCRELATALTARALLRTAEGDFDGAWQDLLACHRLGRLVGRGGTLIEALVGIAIDLVAGTADLAFLERANLTAKQIRDCMRDLRELPPLPAIADKIDLGERFMFLDTVQLVRRGGVGMLEALSGGPAPRRPDTREQLVLDGIDWSPALRNGNRWYDRLVTALRVKDRAGRGKQLDDIEADLKALKKNAAAPANLIKALLAGGDPDKAVGKELGDILIGLLMPAARKVQNAADRAEQVQRNLHIAFALAAYRSDHRCYPAKLEELAPGYLPAVPDDLFWGNALRYYTSNKGYLFYSVGVNGRDEGGRSYDDDPAGDDLGVRMPLPDLKPKR
jgi:hypothetical protein